MRSTERTEKNRSLQARVEQSHCWPNGKPIASGRVEKTLPNVFSMTDGLDVGLDLGSPVSRDYEPPFRFTGKLRIGAPRLALESMTNDLPTSYLFVPATRQSESQRRSGRARAP